MVAQKPRCFLKNRLESADDWHMGADRDWMKPTSEYAEDWRSAKRAPADPMIVRVVAPSSARWVLHLSIGFLAGFGLAALLGLI